MAICTIIVLNKRNFKVSPHELHLQWLNLSLLMAPFKANALGMVTMLRTLAWYFLLGKGHAV